VDDSCIPEYRCPRFSSRVTHFFFLRRVGHFHCSWTCFVWGLKWCICVSLPLAIPGAHFLLVSTWNIWKSYLRMSVFILCWQTSWLPFCTHFVVFHFLMDLLFSAGGQVDAGDKSWIVTCHFSKISSSPCSL
jgi:hypothetical protein